MANNAERIVVIGGGAAGIFAAIACAEKYSNRQITVLEASNQFLSKVYISGGGRCNVTHHCYEPSELVQHYPRGSRELRGAFTRFQPYDIVHWFESKGVLLKTEADGRIFPVSDKSETIASCLFETAIKLGITLEKNSIVKSVKEIKQYFLITLQNKTTIPADKLLIATGGSRSGYVLAQALGHSIQSPVPSLFTFKIKDPRLQNLAGITVPNVKLRLFDMNSSHLEQIGAIVITHWGISGPAVLKLSSWGARIFQSHNYRLSLAINWLPDLTVEMIHQILQEFKLKSPKRKIVVYSPVSLPKRLWQNLTLALGISRTTTWSELSKKMINRLISELTFGKYQIQGKGKFKEEFVTCGGVSLKEVDFTHMESKLCPNLYFAGEVLDIDGITGGFNFQNAWTTGWLAGQAMAK